MECKKTPSTMAGMYEGAVKVWAPPLSFRLAFPYKVCTALPEFSSILGRNLGKWLFILFAKNMLLVSGKVSEHRGRARPRRTVASSMDVAQWEWRETQDAKLGACGHFCLPCSFSLPVGTAGAWGIQPHMLSYLERQSGRWGRIALAGLNGRMVSVEHCPPCPHCGTCVLFTALRGYLAGGRSSPQLGPLTPASSVGQGGLWN